MTEGAAPAHGQRSDAGAPAATAAAGFTGGMNASDAVLWRIERDPELRSTVTAVAVLDRLPDLRRLHRRVEEAVAALPRLRQRVAEPAGGWIRPRWVDAGYVDLGYHLRTVAAPPGDPRWLLDFAASLAEAGFDRTRPLWEIVVVEGLDDGRAALVIKVHHSLTDGVGGVQLMTGLLDWSRRPRRRPPAGATHPPAPSPRSPGAPCRPLRGWLRWAAHPAGAGLGVWRAGVSAGRLLAPAGGRRSPVLAGRSTSWRFDVHDEALDDLRRAGAATGGTINDVFVAAVARGLYLYHREHGVTLPEARVTLPISIRGGQDPPGGNRFTPVRFDLPIDQPDAAERVREIGALCRRWRQEPALPLTDAIAGILGVLPAPATTAVMASLLKGVDVVVTNVPGIRRRCYVAGAELVRQYGFGPPTGAALSVALVSHGATACIGVNSDRRAVGDPDVLLGCLSEGFAEVAALGRSQTAS